MHSGRRVPGKCGSILTKKICRTSERRFYGQVGRLYLGAPVEFWPMESMKNWAEYIGDDFPRQTIGPKLRIQMKTIPDKRFCKLYPDGIKGVPVDDDVTYTLGLLIAEEYGLDFTVEDVELPGLSICPWLTRQRRLH